MSMIAAWQDIRRTMDGAIATMMVTPIVPDGRMPIAKADRAAALAGLRDASSGWSLYITYEDAAGEISERRITVRRIERGLGGSECIGAYCHERQAPRAFRIDRIREMVDLSTGEVIDAGEHIDLLRAQGLPIVDRGIATFSKMLVFMGLCDGHGHAAEWREIDWALERYALRCGGDDASLEEASKAARGLAPDGRDFTNCLGTLIRTPPSLRKQVAKLTIESCAKIVDADGRHAPEELHWGAAVGAALKRLAV